MIEEKVLSFLSEKMELPCYMERPETMPDEFIVIEKTSSGVSNRIYRATFAIQSYAGSLFRAAEISNAIVRNMEEITTVSNISKCSLNSEYNFTDTAEKTYRYQAVFDLTFMEV